MIAGLLLGCLSSQGALINETFAIDPLAQGWKIFGDTNLFQWNATTQKLAITWDSSRSNSYFYLPLGTILNREDSFSCAFDLELSDLAAGVNPTKPSTFPLAIGFLNLLDATNSAFFRGNGFASPNLVEFNFFPDTGFGPTLWPSIWSTNSVLNYNGPSDYAILDLPIRVPMRITLIYSNQALSTTITTNGVAIGAMTAVPLSASFSDFRVAAFAVESYNDAGQHPQYGGSLLGHGTIDNLLISFPPPPVQSIVGRWVNDHWAVAFMSRTNWLYLLERSTNFGSWTAVSSALNGNGGEMLLQDTNPPAVNAFFRVNARKP